MLPTEQRFMELTDNQKMLLLVSYMENVSSEDLYAYAKHERLEKSQRIKIDNAESEGLKAVGYTDEQIERMNDQISKAGFDG